jgi:ribosomal-protein-alanine N-acetyltransferase
MPDLRLVLPKRIDTPRLTLRSYQAGDGPWFFAMSQHNRAHLARYEAENVVLSVTSEQEAEDLVRALAADWAACKSFFVGAFDRETDQFVAQVYIGPVNLELPEFEIGFFVDQNYQGRGYVTEAVKALLEEVFTHLKAHRVRMECDDTNESSWRVAERCGFVLEGHLRENRKNADGSLSGTLVFGLLRHEFGAQQDAGVNAT